MPAHKYAGLQSRSRSCAGTYPSLHDCGQRGAGHRGLPTSAAAGEEVQNGKEQEEKSTQEGDEALRDPLAKLKPLSAKDSEARADRVPHARSHDDTEGVLVRRERDCRDLRAVAPLGQECQHERLQEDGSAHFGEESPCEALMLLRRCVLQGVLDLLKLFVLIFIPSPGADPHQAKAEEGVKEGGAVVHSLL
eukprot:CAMPEP_0175626944 /NCGR_PEP_ID=MMETSP0096-20121207/71244_1 /TAXON_ID=311494 /ORGANISM="Alexandrium monilatum, Strain CCMP3105" /LENGTH=191 /DNA_ID=CAMNT_0016932325 /DNA_START=9 /DNA_END=584 /DNA_ORIENTATION=-